MGLKKTLKKYLTPTNVAAIAASPFTAGASLALLEDGKGHNIAGYLTGAAQTAEANKQNAEQAQLNRDWQEYMSNTAYQRGYADMKAAGLNPILAGGSGGASTPSGAQAEMQPAPSWSESAAKLGETFNSVSGGLNSLSNAAKTSIESKFVEPTAKAEIAKTTAETVKTQAETANIEAQTAQLRKEFEILSREDQIEQETFYNRYETAIANHEGDKALARLRSEWVQTEWGKKMIKAGFNISQIGQLLSPAGEATTSAGKQIGAALTTRKIGFRP